MRAQLSCASSKRGYDEDDFGGCGRKFIAAVFSRCRSGSNAGRQYQHRQADDDRFRERLRQVSLEGFDRAQRLCHADRFVERQVAVARSPLRKYDNAPMPFAVFFNGGYAVHATFDLKRLGRPASHGCVRLHPDNAAQFFSLARQAGLANTRVVITR
ncbi:L,D-transpeptidase [Rhizobium beringeri]